MSKLTNKQIEEYRGMSKEQVNDLYRYEKAEWLSTQSELYRGATHAMAISSMVLTVLGVIFLLGGVITGASAFFKSLTGL